MKSLHTITFILLIIGGLNWLIMGLADTDLFAWLGWGGSMIAKIVYILVGLSAVYEIFTHKKMCRNCGMGGASSSM